MKQAAALPVVISVKDVYDETCTELLVLANLDSGARGRPRVTYDVTAALNAMQLCVFMADLYIESPVGDVEQRPQELHRFLVHCRDGCRLCSAAEKRCDLCCCTALPHGRAHCMVLNFIMSVFNTGMLSCIKPLITPLFHFALVSRGLCVALQPVCMFAHASAKRHTWLLERCTVPC